MQIDGCVFDLQSIELGILFLGHPVYSQSGSISWMRVVICHMASSDGYEVTSEVFFMNNSELGLLVAQMLLHINCPESKDEWCNLCYAPGTRDVPWHALAQCQMRVKTGKSSGFEHPSVFGHVESKNIIRCNLYLFLAPGILTRSGTLPNSS